MTQKRNINIRLGEQGLAVIDSYADEFRLSRTAVIRAMLAVARNHTNELRSTLTTMKENS